MSERSLDLIARREGARWLLCSPEVGLFAGPAPRGRALAAGDAAGVIRTLAGAFELCVPPGVEGRVANDPPARVHEPVGWGSVLYELEPQVAAAAAASAAPRAAAAPKRADAGLVLRSPGAGRWWLRPAPGEPPFVALGAEIAEGQAVGLIEVMKTFARVHYRAGGGLPPRARVLGILVADGAEIAEGQPLLELEAR